MKIKHIYSCVLIGAAGLLLPRLLPGEDSVQFLKNPIDGPYSFIKEPINGNDIEQIRDSLPIKSFDLKKSAPPDLFKLEPGVRYQIKFKKDGTAIYRGFKGVEKIGVYSGKIELLDFARLSFLYEELTKSIDEGDELGKVPSYSHSVISELRVDFKNGKKIEHKDDSNFGDLRFWILENAIQRIASETKWSKFDLIDAKE